MIEGEKLLSAGLLRFLVGNSSIAHRPNQAFEMAAVGTLLKRQRHARPRRRSCAVEISSTPSKLTSSHAYHLSPTLRDVL
jgi:hypothetical protein